MPHLLRLLTSAIAVTSALREHLPHTRYGRRAVRHLRNRASAAWATAGRFAAPSSLARRAVSTLGVGVLIAFAFLGVAVVAVGPIAFAVVWIRWQWVDFPFALSLLAVFYLHVFREPIQSTAVFRRLTAAAERHRMPLRMAAAAFAVVFVYLLFTTDVFGDTAGPAAPIVLLKRGALGCSLILLAVTMHALDRRQTPREAKRRVVREARGLVTMVFALGILQTGLATWQLVFALTTFGVAEPPLTSRLAEYQAFTRATGIVAQRRPDLDLAAARRKESEKMAQAINWLGFSFAIGLLARMKGRCQTRLALLESGLVERYRVTIREKGVVRFYERFSTLALLCVVTDVCLSAYLGQFLLGSIGLVALSLLGLGLDIYKRAATRYAIVAATV